MKLTKFHQLKKRLEDECHLEIPDGTRFERVRAGHWQRSAGALSWCVIRPSGRMIGGFESVTKMLKFRKLSAEYNVRTDCIEVDEGK